MHETYFSRNVLSAFHFLDRTMRKRWGFCTAATIFIHHGKSKIKTRFVTYCLTISIECPTKVPYSRQVRRT